MAPLVEFVDESLVQLPALALHPAKSRSNQAGKIFFFDFVNHDPFHPLGFFVHPPDIKILVFRSLEKNILVEERALLLGQQSPQFLLKPVVGVGNHVIIKKKSRTAKKTSENKKSGDNSGNTKPADPHTITFPLSSQPAHAQETAEKPGSGKSIP